MASTIKTSYGTNNQAITITLASLASSTVYVGRASTAVDNTVNLYLDALVQCKITTGTSPSANTLIQIYVYGSADNGTTYGENATGTDAGLTITNPPNIKLIGVINNPVTTSNVTYKTNPLSVAAAFGGVLPAFWGVFITQSTGALLNGTAGNHAVFYQGIYAQTTP